VQNIILGLLKENREDLKTVLSQQASMGTEQGTILRRLEEGDARMGSIEKEIAGIKMRCKGAHKPGQDKDDESDSGYRPHPSKRERAAEAKTEPMMKRLKFDPSLWVKIGLLAGGIAAGWAAANRGTGS
jgi:hypothetical protein